MKFERNMYFCRIKGALTQLARVSHWQCGSHRFKSDMLHEKRAEIFSQLFFVLSNLFNYLFLGSNLINPLTIISVKYFLFPSLSS